MHNKSLLALFLFVGGSVALIGCTDSFTGADGRATIKFSSWGATQDQIVYDEMFRRFERANPDIRLSLMFIPFNNYFTKLQLLIVGGVAPDTVTVSQDMMYQLCLNGHLVDLEPFIAEERKRDPTFLTEQAYTIDVLKPSCSFNGHMYYIPIGPMARHVYFNKDLFDAAGVPYPQEGWTWNDLLDAAQRLTLRDESGRTTQWGFLCASWIDFWRLFILQNGGEVFDDWAHPTRCTLDSPEAIEALTFVQDLIYKYKVSPNPIQAAQTVNTDFMTGRLAMTIHGTWMIEQYRTIKSFHWDMAPLPIQKYYANLAGADGYGMTAQCKDPAKAWRFLRNFLTEDTQNLMSTDCSLWQPILRKSAEDGHMDHIPGVPEHHNLRFSELSRATPITPLHHPQARRILYTIDQEMEPLFQGKEEPSTCLPRVAAKINAMLQEGGE